MNTPASTASAITDEQIIERVEEEVGMGHGGWDCVDPAQLVAAFRLALAAPATQPTGQAVDASQPAPAKRVYPGGASSLAAQIDKAREEVASWSKEKRAMMRLEGPVEVSRTPAPAAPSDWQPIETAPKDGTEILGHTQTCGALVLYWNTTTADYEYWSDGMSMHQRAPTHWMPLPAPPAAIASSTKASGGTEQ
jgi:hypothetical protein